MKSATNRVAGRSKISTGGPTCSMRPAFITAIRSLITSASCWSWVTNTAVMPSLRVNWRSSTCIASRSLRSSAPNGSSRSSTLGEITSARASATRCCCPPDIWCG